MPNDGLAAQAWTLSQAPGTSLTARRALTLVACGAAR